VSFSRTFENCSNLKHIPETLFRGCQSAGYFNSTFCNTPIREIPQSLFWGCSKVLTFSCTFYNCSKIKRIPDALFIDCTRAFDFSGCFYGCSGVEEAGSEIFRNCLFIRSMSHCFYGCKSLKKLFLNVYSRIVDNVHMFVPNGQTDTVVAVPYGSSTDSVFGAKTKSLGIKVARKPFLWASICAFIRSVPSILAR